MIIFSVFKIWGALFGQHEAFASAESLLQQRLVLFLVFGGTDMFSGGGADPTEIKADINVTPLVDVAPFYGTTGIGGDLYAAAQAAVRAMVDHIAGTSGLSPEDAYVLASLCVDLKISEIVDAGQYVVSAVLPEVVFSER